MPEGDAVRRTADRLDRALAGQVLLSSDLRVPQLATVDLAGAHVTGTATHGKHLLTRMFLSDGAGWTLHTHLRMEGSWVVLRPGGRWPRPAHLARAVLRTERAEAVGFELGLVELLPTAQEASVVGHLGPDLLGGWTATEQQAAVTGLLRDPTRVLGEALLDQTVVAGMGTIWVAEACFVHGANPLAPVGAAKAPARLLQRTRQMMRASLVHGRPLTTGDRRQPLWVYGRHRQPCLRCGTTLRAGRIGPPTRERTTYWCPLCQPLPTEQDG